jgi:hypothetical protein
VHARLATREVKTNVFGAEALALADLIVGDIDGQYKPYARVTPGRGDGTFGAAWRCAWRASAGGRCAPTSSRAASGSRGARSRRRQGRAPRS